jgi:hypothetical protein
MSGYWNNDGRRTPADEALVRECDEWQRWRLDCEARMQERGSYLRLDDGGECDEGERVSRCA